MYLKYLERVQIGKRKGVISTVTIPANVPICEFKGNVFTFDELNKLEKPEDALQVGPNIYLGPTGTVADKIRHSCNPNCMIHAVGKRAFLYSLYVIKENFELTFDYSTSSNEDPSTWEMNCTCGDFNCRKKISGFYQLNEDLQNKYKAKSIAALYIREPQIFLTK